MFLTCTPGGQFINCIVDKLHLNRCEDHRLDFVEQVSYTIVYSSVALVRFWWLVCQIWLYFNKEHVEPPENRKVLAFNWITNLLQLALDCKLHLANIEISLWLNCFVIFVSDFTQKFIHLNNKFSVAIWWNLSNQFTKIFVVVLWLA